MNAPEDKVQNPGRVLLLTLYYLAIIVTVIYLHGRGGLVTPPFIYQGF